jgi:uncharacterized protein (TIGR03437 family)
MKQLRNLTGAFGAATMFVSLCAGQAPIFNISNFAGNGSPGYAGDGSTAAGSQLDLPYSVAVAGSNVYISDQANNRVRLVSNGNISTVAGSGTSGSSGDGAAATKANMASPTGVATDSSGNLYISDTVNAEVRKVTGANINQFAGTAGTAGFAGDGALATAAEVDHPSGLLVDSAGNVYIVDTFNDRIRKVTTDGNIATFAGNGNTGFSGDGGPAISAALNSPEGIAIDAAGNIYIADTVNNRIRKITTDGNINTIAGSSTADGYGGDGGKATSALLNHPRGVAVDGAGNVYIADTFNHRIRVVVPSGLIYTIAGLGVQGYAGDGGPALLAEFNFPTGVTVSGGNVYVTDSSNDAIRLLTPAPQGPQILSSGIVGASAFGGSNTVAPGSWIEIYGTNLSTTTRSWGAGDFHGINAPQSLDNVSVTIGGQTAFVSYVSPTQVNAQIPSGVGLGTQQVFVSNITNASSPAGVTIAPTMPGLLAPAQLNVGGKQYVAAFFSDGAYVLPPAAVPGLTSRQAKPGDTIVLYGVGFGPVSPVQNAGQIVQLLNRLQTPVQMLFGQTAATLAYQGLAPGLVGLYQFNVVVPNVAANSALQFSFSQGGAPGTQTLYTAITN